jgi:hypothetical protein
MMMENIILAQPWEKDSGSFHIGMLINGGENGMTITFTPEVLLHTT